jgi:hypothetical protein
MAERGNRAVRRIGAGLAAVVLLCMTLGVARADAAASRAAAPPDDGEASSWIVVLAPGHDAGAEAFGLAAEHGGRAEHVYSHVFQGFSFRGSAQAADSLRHNPNVERVDADGTLSATEEIAPNGVVRIDGWTAHEAGYTGRTTGGTKVRAAILDTGIQSNHPDLAANVNTAEGKNCISGGAPEDDHSHGTHVAGTVAAAFNGTGVVGVATDASLVAVKVLDAAGNGTDSQIICGIDWVVGLAADHVPTVMNFSLGDPGRAGETLCSSSPLHQAICSAVNAGVTVVAAAGNSAVDATEFVPASFPEVIAVSAHSDLDHIKNNYAGCDFDLEAGYVCDDTMAEFSNWGTVVDVMAPGVRVYSTVNNGGWDLKSGTSMAAPHVTGVVALVRAANPSLSPAAVRDLIERTGECPDGATSNAPTCAGHGQWTVSGLFGTHPDPDGVPEPLVNALAAAQAAGTPGPVDTTGPATAITAPAVDGTTVSGTTTVSASATDASGVTKVEFLLDGVARFTDTSAGYAWPWDTTTASNGTHTLQSRATDTAGNVSTSAGRTVNVQNGSPPPPTVRTHVAALDGSAQAGSKSSWIARVTVTVRDQNGGLVSGATVTFSLSGGASGSASCTTSASGTCTVSKSVQIKKTSATFTVTGISKANTTYDSAANAISSRTVTKP